MFIRVLTQNFRLVSIMSFGFPKIIFENNSIMYWMPEKPRIKTDQEIC